MCCLVDAQYVIQPCVLGVNTCLDLVVLVGFPYSAENKNHTMLSLCQSQIMLKPKSIC